MLFFFNSQLCLLVDLSITVQNTNTNAGYISKLVMILCSSLVNCSILQCSLILVILTDSCTLQLGQKRPLFKTAKSFPGCSQTCCCGLIHLGLNHLPQPMDLPLGGFNMPFLHFLDNLDAGERSTVDRV